MLFCHNLQFQPGHILRQRDGELQPLLRNRVEEGQMPRMERGTANQLPVLRSVEEIPGEGVAAALLPLPEAAV